MKEKEKIFKKVDKNKLIDGFEYNNNFGIRVKKRNLADLKKKILIKKYPTIITITTEI